MLRSDIIGLCLAVLTTRFARGIPNAKVEMRYMAFAEMPGPRHALGLRVSESIIWILSLGKVIPGPLIAKNVGKSCRGKRLRDRRKKENTFVFGIHQGCDGRL